MEHAIEVGDVGQLTQALVSTWEDRVLAAVEAEFGKREGAACSSAT
jgi:hypothetical protein